ncbi:MAG TPA: bifunctional glutamate N-acetyltransferase/amino-acid acetyltransferase ArgJ [Candidatus Acidoferrum sp.]|nr:bifunctional glutamate N-acetyltransferase/amino-acid acetyltransferase ArgJ [Candidatus Acidoferrum sp.]
MTAMPAPALTPVPAPSSTTPDFTRSGESPVHVSKHAIPRGFAFGATHCGLKKSKLDLAVFISEAPASAAAVFTTNRVQAAPVVLCREHLKKSGGKIRAIIVNSGNANCCTGPQGMAASRATAAHVARTLGCRAEEILVSSTGVIGAPLRVEKILAAIPALTLACGAEPSAFEDVARAIMTTDTRPKWASVTCRIGGKQVRLLGCAKGSGMIHPNMATTLSYVVTDAAIAPALLSRALQQAVGPTFNSITVDGDTSTNDTLAVLANGQSGARRIAAQTSDYKKFVSSLRDVCGSLALAIVEDGEGAQRVIEIEVRGASSDRAADQVARTIANSSLVKTAFAGADPNWGRILAAAGRSGVNFDPERVDIWLAGISVCRRGRERAFDEGVVHERMLAKHVPVLVDLRSGKGRARMWTCDFTQEYVHINASYRT